MYLFVDFVVGNFFIVGCFVIVAVAVSTLFLFLLEQPTIKAKEKHTQMATIGLRVISCCCCCPLFIAALVLLHTHSLVCLLCILVVIFVIFLSLKLFIFFYLFPPFQPLNFNWLFRFFLATWLLFI